MMSQKNSSHTADISFGLFDSAKYAGNTVQLMTAYETVADF